MKKRYILLIIIILLIILPKSYPNGYSDYSTLTPNSLPAPGGCFSSCAGIQSDNFCFGLIMPQTCNNFTANFNYFGIFDLIIK